MTDRPLISLDDHEDRAHAFFWRFNQKYESVPNGIACPSCKGELRDVDRRILLTTAPPKYATICPACGYRGYRTVA